MMDNFFLQDIVLENDVIKLVPFNESFKEGLRNIIYDKEITKYTGNHIETEVDLKNYIRRTLKSRADKSRYPFVVFNKKLGQVAGSTSFGNLEFKSKRLEIGWTWYGETFRGTETNKATKYEMLRFSFEELYFNRVQFSIDAENLRSQKAVLKLGAKQEGTFRSNYVNEKGEPRDDVYFSIIKTEWSEIKSSYFKEFIK
jgi:RimJ/RimL family protein N-acetyltransferase